MKKIMFNDRYGLTQAVLEGKKTMTRRDAGVLNHPLVVDISEWGIDDKGKAYVMITYSTGLKEAVYPTYQPGEEIAIAQPYMVIAQQNREWFDLQLAANGQCIRELLVSNGWGNKMFVRADLMPHRIRITNIKIERLQDISEEDAMREGVFKYDKPPLHHELDMYAPWAPHVIPYKWDGDNLIYRCTARYAFAYLIDKISGGGTWNRNPWDFAYEFELIKF